MDEQYILYLRNQGYTDEQIQAMLKMGQFNVPIPSAVTKINQKWGGGQPMTFNDDYEVESIPSLPINPLPTGEPYKPTTFSGYKQPMSMQDVGMSMGKHAGMIGLGTEIGSAGLMTAFNNDGKYTDREAGTVGALKYAGRGLQIGSNPMLMAATGGLSAPIGAAVGAIGGAIGGTIANKNERNRMRTFKNDMLSTNKDNMIAMGKGLGASMLPNAYQKGGTNTYGSYAYGGKTNSSYEVEGGEVMMQTGQEQPMALNGGYMESISPTMQEIKGRSHKNGGVDAINDGFVFSNRLKADSSKYLKRL